MTWRTRYSTKTENVAPDETDESAAGATIETLHSVRVWYVEVFRAEGPRIRFVVNHREGRALRFTDPRERSAGTLGTTGIWGTRPAPKAVKPRPMTATVFRFEFARLIGAERAEEMIRAVTAPDFFATISDTCSRKT